MKRPVSLAILAVVGLCFASAALTTSVPSHQGQPESRPDHGHWRG